MERAKYFSALAGKAGRTERTTLGALSPRLDFYSAVVVATVEQVKNDFHKSFDDAMQR